MTLDELVERYARVSAGAGVPVWALGCFHRRSITFCTGATDAETQVIWLQSRGLTADLRLPAGYPRLTGASPLAERAPEVLVALAEGEGGLASATWDGRAMRWSDWTSFQTHDRWPEPGLLARVGDCLTEHAPSGAYVEDWRLKPSATGPLISLRLIEERDAQAGRVRHRGGGLVVCGDHAALVRGRPAPVPVTGNTAEIVRAHSRDPVLMRAVFAFEASYATRSDDDTFIVGASTDPLRVGSALLHPAGFAYDERDHVVIQRAHEGGLPVERVFTVDTLEANVAFPLATEVSTEGQRWLAREGPALLARARRPSAD